MIRRYDTKMLRFAAGLCLIVACTFSLPAVGQTMPDLEVDAVAARSNDSEGSTRLDVYTRVPYSSLRFLATNEGFRARYEVTIEVHELEGDDRAGNLVQTRIFEQSVEAADFAQTQTDRLFDRTIQSLEVRSGRYLIEFQVEDQASNRTLVEKLPVHIRDLSKPLAVSDLILIDSYDDEANSITPTVSSRVGSDQNHFQLFYEVYSNRPRAVHIRRELVRVPKSSGPPSVKSLLGFGSSDNLEGAEVTYVETQPRQIRAGRNQYVVEFPTSDLRVGEYIARVTVEDENGGFSDRAERHVTLQWSGLAEHVRDLDDAIAQLSYIAKRRDIDYIREGRTEDERLNRFQEFWNRRDPTPNTKRNERMEEYYYRIDFANKEYGNFGDGWRTDRGHIMVLFGEPDFVDRHPFNFDVKPYEVWFYYKIGRRFIFIDQTGLGDYELMVPYWDERTRLR